MTFREDISCQFTNIFQQATIQGRIWVLVKEGGWEVGRVA